MQVMAPGAGLGAVDDEVNLAFTAVQHLLAPPQSLFRPAIVARTLRHGAATPASLPNFEQPAPRRPTHTPPSGNLWS